MDAVLIKHGGGLFPFNTYYATAEKPFSDRYD
jgi:hypothetical protein